ncbi:ABC transporter ATP-binding protein [Tianweitania sediminis]|uniref:Dipeptide ABC transporter ATP-binding protein n=1 Tax=Tianweitania sediminis TaxID=1502156 RepID=A0A8J7R536_9HYPH|nr:dipeptide ABC transporter ATP-binding protein [Tianweitania sediminis]MBP0439960.1 dipeptide ABC transporter ATP-binding protein [Tianweitania sediminis]
MIERHETPVLEVEDLTKHFAVGSRGLFGRGKQTVKALDGVSFTVSKGKTIAIVGESGCGKSTLGRTLLRLEQPTSGQVRLDGIDVTAASASVLRAMRRKMQIVFQDPFSSLHPKMTAAQLVAEPMLLHKVATKKEVRHRVAALFDLVGLAPYQMDRYPHQFSGGQRQRIAIARALAVEPSLIVCDEPVSALDVSIQAQIINLLTDLQAKLGVSYVFISHDLGVVRYISDEIAVMYLGRVVEQGTKRELFSYPRHPYTQALLSAVPRPDPSYRSQRIVLKGDLPNPLSPPPGCRFSSRCGYARDICHQQEPQLDAASPSHRVACHFWKQLGSLSGRDTGVPATLPANRSE